jgi:hypothetical protein
MTTAPPSSPAEAAAKRPWQFSLWQLILVMVGVCVLGAAYQWIGWGVLALLGLILVVGLVVGLATIQHQRGLEALLAAGAIFALIMLLLSPIHAPRSSRRDYCSNNLRQILIALHNYHDVYGSLPPAYVADENGRPMHSWRVLILPFIEQQPLYDQYRFDEPWDGPNNRLLLQYDLPFFRCPSDSQATKGETSYVVVSGGGTAWPGAKAVKFGDMTDGTSNTILVVEVQHSGIHWMEPRDLDVTQLPLSLNAPRGPCISSEHKHGAHVGLADGSVRFLPNDLPSPTLRALLTIDGRESVILP